jgi:hypothetical protein
VLGGRARPLPVEAIPFKPRQVPAHA